MNKRFLTSIMLCIIVALGGVSAAGAKDALDPTIVGVGARPLAMGRACTAVADDINVLFTNPAGLGQQDSWGFTSMSTKLMDKVDYKMAGIACPTDHGTLGVGYLSLSTPAGYYTTDKDSLANAQPISYGSSVLMLSYGVSLNDVIDNSSSLGKLSIGADYKMINNQFEGVDGSGSGSSLDLGLIASPHKNFSVGLTLRNLGGAVNWKNGTKEELPMSTRLGGALDLDQVLIAADVEYVSASVQMHGGMEYRPMKNLALRAGIEDSAVTGGVGIKLDRFDFDYAYRQDSTLGENSSHYFSVSFQLEPRVKAKRVEKAEIKYDRIYLFKENISEKELSKICL